MFYCLLTKRLLEKESIKNNNSRWLHKLSRYMDNTLWLLINYIRWHDYYYYYYYYRWTYWKSHYKTYFMWKIKLKQNKQKFKKIIMKSENKFNHSIIYLSDYNLLIDPNVWSNLLWSWSEYMKDVIYVYSFIHVIGLDFSFWKYFIDTWWVFHCLFVFTYCCPSFYILHLVLYDNWKGQI